MSERQPSGAERKPRPRRGPLAGVRVVDFCWAGVGALATRFLADFGAEVIKVEHRSRLDSLRRMPLYKGRVRSLQEEDANPDPEMSGMFNNYSRNKLGVSVNMAKPEGRQLVDRLIAASSLVTENFAPGVMEKWNLTYEHLNELSPEIIFGRMSGFGQTGPYAEYRSFGPIAQAASGLTFISGLPGREPSGWGLSYMDNQAAYYGAAALLMAIYRRNETGKGAMIDASAVETGIYLCGPILLDASVNGRITRANDFPTGNRLEYPDAAPHGVYPSKGEDRWIAIAVFDDDEWRRLVGAMGSPAWAADPRFATQSDRFTHQDALDELMATWTSTLDCHAAMDMLQRAGVRAGAVQNAQDLNEIDPQLAHRQLFFELDHPVIGEARFEGVPVKLSRTTPDPWRSAPLLGEDNNYVFGEILGLSGEEIQDLKEAEVI